MSVNASHPELLQLIHRHLKESGFHSAANELQRHNPQGECSMSASLLDIYRSWLNDPKGKKQPPSAKSSSLKKKGRTPVKDSKSETVNQTIAEDEGSSDSEELSQSLLPQTPLKSCPTIPVKILYTPYPRQGKPAVLVSPVTAVANDSSATTDMPGHVNNTLSMTPKAVKQKKSGKDSTERKNEVKAAAKKQAKSPKTKGKSKLSSTESAGATTGKKKDKPAAKAEAAKKKPGPVKRKTPAGKDEANVSKAKKSKIQMKDVVAAGGGNDSDSDSSLDVEKWKKLVLDMTDADVVKMDVINALDSSAPQPKRRRVRKPAASKETKPPGEENETVEKKSTTNTPAKNSLPKKSRTTTPAPVTPPADPTPEQSINSEKDQPAAPTVSLSEQNSIGVTLSEEQTEGATPKKKKKKKKEANENKDIEEEMKKGSETIGQVPFEKPLEETKKAKGGRKQNEYREDVVTEDLTVIPHYDEVPDSVVPEQKKEKKAKKKEKSEQEEDQVNSEQISEKANDGTGEIMSAKKKKKKKSKTDAENSEATDKENEIIPAETPSENSNLADKERKTKRERDKSDFQDPSEQILKKKKRKKDKADLDETTHEQVDKDKNEIADINSNNHSESTLKNDSAPLPQLIPETPQTEKKKKKSKLKSTDVPATLKTPSPDSEEASHQEVFFQPPSVIHKKKKKSSKKTSPEDI